MSVREVRAEGGVNGSNILRIVYDSEKLLVWVETTGNHGGVEVHTLIQMHREHFRALVRELGVLT